MSKKLLVIPNLFQSKDLSNQTYQVELERLAQQDVDITTLDLKVDKYYAFGNYLGVFGSGDAVVFSVKNFLPTEEVDLILNKIDSVNKINDVIDYSEAAESEIYFNGNASLVVDEKNEAAYCAISENADEELFIEFCEEFEYDPVFLSSTVFENTSEFLFVSEKFALVCLDAIQDKKEKKHLVATIKKDNLEIIKITIDQAKSFLTQGVEVNGKLLLSKTAISVLDNDLKNKIESYVKLVEVDFDLHEKKFGLGLSNYFINIP